MTSDVLEGWVFPAPIIKRIDFKNYYRNEYLYQCMLIECFLSYWRQNAHVAKTRHVVGIEVPILMDDVTCTGSEDNILKCKMSAIGVNDCFHDEDVSIVCTGKTLSIEWAVVVKCQLELFFRYVIAIPGFFLDKMMIRSTLYHINAMNSICIG